MEIVNFIHDAIYLIVSLHVLMIFEIIWYFQHQ